MTIKKSQGEKLIIKILRTLRLKLWCKNCSLLFWKNSEFERVINIELQFLVCLVYQVSDIAKEKESVSFETLIASKNLIITSFTAISNLLLAAKRV